MNGDKQLRGEKTEMRSLHKYGTMVAAAALLASGTVAQAADADLQSLQQQINQLQQQLKDMQAKQAAAPVAATPAAVETPTASPYDVLMPNPARGAFVIPGTHTTLHVGGFIDLSSTYDTGSSIGPAGYIQGGFNAPNVRSNTNNLGASGTNAGSNGVTYGTSKIALPGTPAAKAVGRFQMDPRFSRIDFETDTPSEFGDIGTLVEMDFDGDGLTANQKLTYSVSPRVRRAFVTVGNLLIGQTFQLTYDPYTNVGSIDNNSYMGQESGNRWPQIQYRWNIDAAQKHQAYVSVEAPYNDVVGVGNSDFLAGGDMTYQWGAVSHVPDINAKYVENGSWGRFFVAGTLRQISVNSNGLSGTAAGIVPAGDSNPVHDSIWTGGVNGGAKVYTNLGDRRNAGIVNGFWGPGYGRSDQYNPVSSAVINQQGKLETQNRYGFDVAYQHWFNDHWQANMIYGLEHVNNKTGLQNTAGLFKEGQQTELNVFWMPTSYLNFGLAWIWMHEAAVNGVCNYGGGMTSYNGGVCAAGNTPGFGPISGDAAVDNRFQFRTRVTF